MSGDDNKDQYVSVRGMIKKLLKLAFVALAVFAILIIPVGKNKKLYELLPVQEAKIKYAGTIAWCQNTWSELVDMWFTRGINKD